MNISGFTTESLEAVQDLLYAEGQVNPLEGECGQKAKRQTAAKPRTPAQQEADKLRSQQRRGKAQGSSAGRSEAAKKAAATRKKCKGGSSTTSTPAGPTT